MNSTAAENQETTGKSKNVSLMARVPENQVWIIDRVDKIAKEQKRSRTYVVLNLLGKFLPDFNGEVL